MAKSVWDMSDEEARTWSAANSAPDHVRQRNREREADEDRARRIRMERDAEC